MKTIKFFLSLLFVVALNSFSNTVYAVKDIRLLLVNGSSSDEMLIGFWAGATDGFDAYDSHKIPVDVNGIPELYTFAGTEQVVINGLPLLNVGDTKLLNMGYRISCNTTLTLKVKEILNIDSGTVILLKDKVLNKEMDLMKIAEYSFVATPGEINDRFSITIVRNAYTAPIVNTTTTSTPVTTTSTPVATTTTSVTVDSSVVSTPPVVVSPDFSVLVNKNRTLEIKLINWNSKGIKIAVKSISGRSFINASATGSLTTLNTSLPKGQYVVTVSGKNVSKSKVVIVS